MDRLPSSEDVLPSGAVPRFQVTESLAAYRSSALMTPDLPPEIRKLGTLLLDANERSERMIEGLLVLARSDRGLSARQPVRLDRIVQTVTSAAAVHAKAAGVTIEAHVQPRTVAGDPILLERLVTNLVDNAIAYNTRGGWVRVDVGAAPARIVSNTGREIPADRIDTLFERSGACRPTGQAIPSKPTAAMPTRNPARPVASLSPSTCRNTPFFTRT